MKVSNLLSRASNSLSIGGGIFSLVATIVVIYAISDGFKNILKIADAIADPLQIAIVLVLILVGSTSL